MTSIGRPIFTSNNGPIAFFLETASVQNRRLVRGLIKEHGGEVVHEPLKADILIAEGDSKAVMDFIEAWGTDKVILDTFWIHRCVKMGKILDGSHSWGGHTMSNRSSIDGVSDLTEEMKDENKREKQLRLSLSPPLISHSKKADNEKGPTDNLSGAFDPQAYLHKMISSQNLDLPPTKKRKLKENVETSDVHIAPTSLPRSQTPPHSTQIYGTSPSMSTPAFSQSTQNVLAALGQQVLSSPQFIPFLGPALQHIFAEQSNKNPDLVAAQLRDIAQVISVSSASQQPPQMPRSTTSPIHSPTPRTSNLSSIKSEDEVEPTLTTSNYRQKNNSAPFSDDGIQRAYRTFPPLKKPFAKEDSMPTVIQQTGFFSNLDGSPSKFFIDLNIRNRRDLINNVKRNGGVIVSSTSESDYVVLKKSQSQTAAATVPLDKTAVSHEWLDECVRRNEFVPPEPFLIEITPNPKRRRKQVSSSPQKKAISTQG